jgi:NMD protein affecting ribosome stability and mRNA decay
MFRRMPVTVVRAPVGVNVSWHHMAMTKAEPACLSCGHTKSQVPQLVGTAGGFICSDCIAKLNDIVTRSDLPMDTQYCSLCRSPGPSDQRLRVPGKSSLCYACVTSVRAAIINAGGDFDAN